jgi:hypothetical protein
MKISFKNILTVASIFTIGFVSIKICEAAEEKNIGEHIANSPPPSRYVFKTKKDYFDLMAVALSKDPGVSPHSFCAQEKYKDYFIGDGMRGMDFSAISYTSITKEEYAKSWDTGNRNEHGLIVLSNDPEAELSKQVIDNDPFTEVYECRVVNFKEVIDDGELSTKCIKIK